MIQYLYGITRKPVHGKNSIIQVKKVYSQLIPKKKLNYLKSNQIILSFSYKSYTWPRWP